jgi:uncharacterized protein (DUF433 family)
MATRASITAPERIPLGIGFYTVADAARLLRTPSLNIRRWLGGYRFRLNGKTINMLPLWTPELPALDEHLELGFRDLVELRFVIAFTKAGMGLKAIRHCLDYAREIVNDERPFSTRKFRTDGRTIFFDRMQGSHDAEILDVKKRQYVFKRAIARTFKDLDIEQDVVTRWRPFEGKSSIVVDPSRAFGQAIMSEFGIPTAVLADAVDAEGSLERVSALYDVPAIAVRDAVKFEEYLNAA